MFVIRFLTISINIFKKPISFLKEYFLLFLLTKSLPWKVSCYQANIPFSEVHPYQECPCKFKKINYLNEVFCAMSQDSSVAKNIPMFIYNQRNLLFTELLLTANSFCLNMWKNWNNGIFVWGRSKWGYAVYRNGFVYFISESTNSERWSLALDSSFFVHQK